MPQKSLTLLCVAGIVLANGMPLPGSVIQPGSSADFVDVDLNLDLLPPAGGGGELDANIGNIAPASGTTTATYDVTNPVLGVDAEAGASPGVVTTAGVSAASVTSNASSSIGRLPGSRTTQATHTIENFALSIVDLPLPTPDLISITADALSVNSAAVGEVGSILAEGALDVTNLRIFASGIQAGTTLNGSIAPNTEIGLNTIVGDSMLILNQQILTDAGANTAGVATNAMSLQLADVEVSDVGTLNGGVTVGSTVAALALAPAPAPAPAAVPEPSSWMLLGMLGLGGIFLQWRRRTRVISSGITAA